MILEMKKTIGILFLIICYAFNIAAQGYVRGKIIDGETGESLIGATVAIPGTTKGTITDFDGNYSLTLDPGTYALSISYVSYETQQFEEVEVVDGEVTIINANLGEATTELEAVVVTARSRQQTESALQVMQRKSAVVMDGISAQQISRLGDSDAAGALKRVTGVSVQDGKYVYVRGLSDRYMKITLNGAEVPGLDPNFNTVQMDLFPSNVVENMTVLKTFSPDQPSFTGGLVDITTKSFPEQFNLQFSASTGFNTNAHFGDDYISYKDSETDYLGFDNGFRDMPDAVVGIDLPTALSSNADEVYQYSSEFNGIFNVQNATAPVNQSYSLSAGGQTNMLGLPLGLVGSVSYKREAEFYKNGRLDDYDAQSADVILGNELLSETKGSDDVIWSALLSGNLKLNQNNKLSLVYLRNQNGQQNARFMQGVTLRSDNYSMQQRSLEYLERSLAAYQVLGKHVIPWMNNATIDWLSSYTNSTQDEPDIRFFINQVDVYEGDTAYSTRSNRKPERRYREMWESNWHSKIDFSIPLQFTEKSSKLKFGASHLEKNRNSDEDRFTVNTRGFVPFSGDPNDFVSDSNLYGGPGGNRGVYYNNDFSANRYLSYNAEDIVTAGYLMVDLALFDNLRLVGGARVEYSEMYIQNKIDTLEDRPSLLGLGQTYDLDYLPSVNVTYEVIENMNVRLGYSKTLGRPSFRERAPYEFYEYTEGLSILGNPGLLRSLADNVDFRWEYFFKRGEMASVSMFYKKIYDPIERYKGQTVTNTSTYRNGFDSDIYGVEFEIRKRLDFISLAKNFEMGANLTFIKSISPVDTLRVRLARQVVPEFPDERPLYGQAPYIVNGFINYTNNELGLSSNLSFNVEGPKIIIISKFQTPDVYQRPYPLVNFNISKSIFDSFEVSFSAKNLINPEFKQTLILENGDEFAYRTHFFGRTFSIGISYSL